MTRLFEAVPSQARILLLGDRDQLASVEAGAVLGDICNAGLENGGFSPGFARAIERLVDLPAELVATGPVPAIRDSIVELTESYRFRAEAGIGRLAAAVNGGDAAATLRCLQEESANLRLLRPSNDGNLPLALRPIVLDGYRDALTASSPEAALRGLERLRVVCAHRRGRFGVAGLNTSIEEWLAGEGLIDPRGEWYAGRPVMVVENDYALALFNGDVGIVRSDSAGGGDLRVFFPAPDGGVRSFAPTRLPPHESVWAMSIHKSQGSEFDHVLVVLPERPSAILTRELLYTGITRARQHVTVVGSDEVIRHAIAERVLRAGGLREALAAGERGAGAER
jgi:exodeoxyribonuclease V alpha subunit